MESHNSHIHVLKTQNTAVENYSSKPIYEMEPTEEPVRGATNMTKLVN